MRAFRLGWTTFVTLATSLPYLFFWLRTPAYHRYSWILPPYPEDSFGYMAWSQQAAHGKLLFQLKYTASPHSPFLFHPFFLICGWISRLFGSDVAIVHWALKAIGVVLFLAVFYRYTDWLSLNRFQSIAASIFVGISSGFGGLFAFLDLAHRWQIVPADLWMPEVSTYWSLLWNPLFPYSLTLIVLTIYWLDRGSRDSRNSDFWLGGFAVGLLALIHPYAVPMLFAYAVIVTLARRGPVAFGLLLRFFSAAFPFVLYVVLVSILQPLVSRHSASGEMKSPKFLAYVLGFGFPLIICVAGLAVKPSQWLKRYWQLLLWFLMSLGFAYLPFWFQRKLILGAQIPLCILAGILLDLILTRLSWLRARNWAMIGGAIIVAPLLIATPVFQLYSENQEVQQNPDGVYYIANELLAALNFLKHESKPDEVVFATYETSRLIPALSGNTVLWGHWAMSVDIEERRQWSARLFYENKNWEDKQRAIDFWGTGIRYILADADLKKSIEQDPEMWRMILADADKVFENSSVVIYKHRA